MANTTRSSLRYRSVGVDTILKERPFSLLTSEFLSEEEREENKKWGEFAFKTLADIDDEYYSPDMTEEEIDVLVEEFGVGGSFDEFCPETHLPTSSKKIAR